MYIMPFESQEDQELPNILIQFVEYLSAKPYCTNRLGNLLIRPKEIALKHVYIQHNPICRAYWLVFDIDNDLHRYWPDEYDIPCPNMAVINRENMHEHLFYLIDPAVYTLRQARRKPLELAADVDRGLTILLGADPAYGKLITKNPFNRKWLVFIYREMAWGLTELIDKIPDRIKKQKVKPQEAMGLGRNCTLFERIRHIAYAQWRKQKFDNYPVFFDIVLDRAQDINSGFQPPMTKQEVKCIARSVAKWTAKNHTEQKFSKIQQVRGIAGNLKSQQVRGLKSQDRAIEAKALYAGGKTQKQIALMLGISERQVRNLLNS